MMFFHSKKINNIHNVKSFFFTKKNGFSKGIYKSLNCGKGSNDNKKVVNKNLLCVSKKIKISKKKLILLHQIHSAKVVDLKKIFIVKKFKADGIATKLSNFALCILTADCVPILIADKKNMNIAAIHAGWKGANSGIVENIIKLMKKKGSKISNLIVAVGPCISHKNYEIKEDFIKKIKKKNSNYRKFIIYKKKKTYFNLRKFIEYKFLNLGIKKNNIEHINKDTYSDKKHFFSYRRSVHNNEPDYGRCISIICRY